jgi:hypothetical protein
MKEKKHPKANKNKALLKFKHAFKNEMKRHT